MTTCCGNWPGSGKAQAFVESWWAAAKGIMMLPANRDDPAAQQPEPPHHEFTLSIRAHTLDTWNFTDTSHQIPETNTPSLQRCEQNTDLPAFVKQASLKAGLSSWMAMLWVKHDSLSKGVLDQMGKET